MLQASLATHTHTQGKTTPNVAETINRLVVRNTRSWWRLKYLCAESPHRSHHPVKFREHKSCQSGDNFFLVCHLDIRLSLYIRDKRLLWLQRWVIKVLWLQGWEPLMISLHLGLLQNGDIMHLFVLLPYKSSLLRYIVFNLSRDRMFKELCEFMEWNPLW